MPIQSHQLKVTGICDVVEFIKDEEGIELANTAGKYLPYPVEYKRGRPKKSDADLLQLTAQAMCLEEMLLCDVHEGFMYYHEIRKRISIPITKRLRDRIKEITEEMHKYFKRNYTPSLNNVNPTIAVSAVPNPLHTA